MENNPTEIIQYAQYAGGNLNILLTSLQKELRGIVSNTTVTHDGKKLLAVEYAEVIISIIEQLNTQIFPLFSDGDSPSSFTLASPLNDLKNIIRSFDKFTNREGELKELQNAFIMFRIFRTIQLALNVNRDLKALLDFFNPCALDGSLLPISSCNDSTKPFTYKIFGKKVCLSEVLDNVDRVDSHSKFQYLKACKTDEHCTNKTQDDNELADNFVSIQALIPDITSQCYEISNSLVEGGSAQRWATYRAQKATLAILERSLAEVKRQFGEAEQKIFSDAGLCYRQYFNHPIFGTVEQLVGVLADNFNNAVRLTTERMSALQEEIRGEFTRRLAASMGIITDNMSLEAHEQLITDLEKLKADLANYPQLFENDAFNNQITDLISKHRAIVNFQQGAEKFEKSCEYLDAIELSLVTMHSDRSESPTTQEKSSTGGNSSGNLDEESVTEKNGSDSSLDNSSGSSESQHDDAHSEIKPKRQSFLQRVMSRRSTLTQDSLEVNAQKQGKQSVWRKVFGVTDSEDTIYAAYSRRMSLVSRNSAANELSDEKAHAHQEEESPDLYNGETTIIEVKAKVTSLRTLIVEQVAKFNLTAANMPSRELLDSRYQEVKDSTEIADKVAILLADKHVREYLNGNHEAFACMQVLEATVKHHIDLEYKKCVKIASRFEERVDAVRARITEVVADYANVRDLKIVLENPADYASRVSAVSNATAEINIELNALRELMTFIDEEVHISEEGMPDVAALRELEFNSGLAAVINQEAEKGTDISKFVSVTDLENGKQELHVSAAKMRNLFQRSFIHQVNAYWLDRDSAVVREAAEEEVNFQVVIDLLSANESTQVAVQHVVNMQQQLLEIDNLLGNKYNLEGTLALYLHDFISQPAEQRTKDNLQQVFLKCKHKLHSYDAEVAEQDKSLWERKVTLVIGCIPIIGQIVLAACYFYNKANYGIGFFPWDTTKKQDAQKKVEDAVADLSESLFSASVAG